MKVMKFSQCCTPGVYSRLIVVQGTEYAIVNWPDLLKVITAHEMIQKFLATQGKKVAMEAAGGAARGGDTDMLVNEPAVDVAPPADVSAATDGVLPLPIAAAASSSALVLGPRFVKVSASVLKTLPGFDKLDKGRDLRQVGRGHVNVEGNVISGLFVVADGGAAVLFDNKTAANNWANNINQVNIEIAPSLTYIDSGHSSVSLLKVD